MSGYHVKMGYHMPTWEAMIYKWYGERQAVQTGIPPSTATIFVEKQLLFYALYLGLVTSKQFNKGISCCVLCL